MRELNVSETIDVQGGDLTAAVLAGAGATLIGWIGIIYNKDVMYQLYKVDNVAMVASLGAMVGGFSYLVGAFV